MNTESAGNSEFGTEEYSGDQSRSKVSRAKSNGHNPTMTQSDSLFKNVPDAISERQKTLHDITVEHNVEKAMRVLKRKLIREGLFKELKLRKTYEKPSEKKKRKSKESLKRARKEEARVKKFMSGLA